MALKKAWRRNEYGLQNEVESRFIVIKKGGGKQLVGQDLQGQIWGRRQREMPLSFLNSLLTTSVFRPWISLIAWKQFFPIQT
jgi:hypothetical protein